MEDNPLKYVVARGILDMPYRDMRSMLQFMSERLSRKPEAILEAMADWADTEMLNEPPSPVGGPDPAGKGPVVTKWESDQITTAGASSDAPSEEVPGGLVVADQGGPGRADLPTHTPISNTVRTEDGFTLSEDGSILGPQK
jgi:hypothetical protein